MVFFMIMPAIFGAFGNFLLPTQLGVHDVAFPRLNSAAFWFLPGGLIMLCQLVCTDRRYARMNCFNIRELQGILKRKFFTDLVNNHEHRTLMDKTMIGLRYKSNNNINLDNDMLSFYNFGITSQVQNESAFFTSLTSQIPNSRPTMGGLNFQLFSLFNDTGLTFFAKVTKVPAVIFSDTVAILFSLNFFSLTHLFNFGTLSRSLLNNFSFINFSFNESPFLLNFSGKNAYGNVNQVSFSGKQVGSSFDHDSIKNMFSENSSAQRFTRFSSSLINYDYKTGHYIGN
jgi:hypothetical protein